MNPIGGGTSGNDPSGGSDAFDLESVLWRGSERVIEGERIRFLNRQTIKDGKYVLYWMQASQRAEYNQALEYAITKANELRQPLVVFFGMTDRFPEANERHYTFMSEGLLDVKRSLGKRGVQFVVRHRCLLLKIEPAQTNSSGSEAFFRSM